MTFSIRAVTPDDFPQWLLLWDGYNAFYGREGATALPRAVTDETWRRIFDTAAPVHALVAEKEGRLIGLAHYLYHFSTSAVALNCYLQDLFTAPDARGQGAGCKLIEAVYADAAAAGAGRVYWQTHETNTTAQKLYDTVAERSGFIVYRHLL